MHILIIEDDEDVLEITRLSLELAGGWHVHAARSGPEGVAMAEATAPDAILLDVMMPGMDGTATLEALRALPSTRDVPVILLSANLRAMSRERFETLGIAGTIAKPYDPMELPERITRLLGSSLAPRVSDAGPEPELSERSGPRPR